MSTNYLKYLIYLSLVIVLFGLFLVYANRRKESKRKTTGKKVKPITLGNISVFFDKSDNVAIIAYVTDLFGVGKASGVPVLLNTPYSIEELGQSVRSAMLQCQKGIPGSDIELMTMLGSRNWKEFSCDKRNVSVHFREGYGVVYNSTTRKEDGAYQFNYKGFEKVLSPNVDNMELGKALKEILQKCRC